MKSQIWKLWPVNI